MKGHEVARAVERVARRQHGVITREQALWAGMTRRAIQWRLEVHDWIGLAPGIYALSAFPPTWQRQYKAAELSVIGSAVCELAAAKVLGFNGFGVVRPEVVAGHTTNHRSRLATVHRAKDIRTTTVHGITVTTPAQTLADLVPRVRLPRWERACDDQLLTGRMTVDDLAERAAAFEGARRHGIAVLRALVADRQIDGWSAPESELEVLLRQAVSLVPSCPTVVWQAELPWGEPGEGRVDGLIPAWGVVLEADGRRWHTRVHDFDVDLWRDNRAAAAGLRVMRFTWVHLTQRLDEVVEIIDEAGAAVARAA